MRPWGLRILDIAFLLAASLALCSYLYANLNDPLPYNPHVDGTLAAIMDRVDAGGPYYVSPTRSLWDATFAYPPGCLIAERATIRLTGWDATFATRVLGVLSLLAFTALGTWSCVALGVPLQQAAAGFLVACLFLRPSNAFQMGFSFNPDFVLLSVAFVLVIFAHRIESPARLTLACLVPLLVLAAIFKLQAICLFCGIPIFLLLRRASPRTWVSSMVALGLASILSIAIFRLWPNCWDSCVAAMADHPRSVRKMARAAYIAFLSLWILFVIPVSSIRLAVPAGREYPGASQVIEKMSPGLVMLVSILFPYLAIQSLAAMKYGGGSYNFEYVAMLALPALIHASSRVLSAGTLATSYLLLAATLGFCWQSRESRREAARKLEELDVGSSYLASKFPAARVMYSAFDYQLVRRAGLQPVTDLSTAWHFASGGFDPSHLLDAIANESYDVVLFRDPASGMWDTPGFSSIKAALAKSYAPVDTEAVPSELRGRLWVRSRLVRLHDHHLHPFSSSARFSSRFSRSPEE